MKKVSLIGDSIRMGYVQTVRDILAGRAEVWSPETNCMHSVHHLFNLFPFYLERDPDIIHMNMGLWDCRRLARGSEENAVPVEAFIRNLDFILGKLRDNSKAVLIWATLTPIVQERYNARFSKPFEPCRVASDVERYNAAAAPVLARHGVEVNDLHALVESHGREKLIAEDGIHYTEEGSAILGRQVAAFIERQL